MQNYSNQNPPFYQFATGDQRVGAAFISPERYAVDPRAGSSFISPPNHFGYGTDIQMSYPYGAQTLPEQNSESRTTRASLRPALKTTSFFAPPTAEVSSSLTSSAPSIAPSASRKIALPAELFIFIPSVTIIQETERSKVGDVSELESIVTNNFRQNSKNAIVAFLNGSDDSKIKAIENLFSVLQDNSEVIKADQTNRATDKSNLSQKNQQRAKRYLTIRAEIIADCLDQISDQSIYNQLKQKLEILADNEQLTLDQQYQSKIYSIFSPPVSTQLSPQFLFQASTQEESQKDEQIKLLQAEIETITQERDFERRVGQGLAETNRQIQSKLEGNLQEYELVQAEEDLVSKQKAVITSLKIQISELQNEKQDLNKEISNRDKSLDLVKDLLSNQLNKNTTLAPALEKIVGEISQVTKSLENERSALEQELENDKEKSSQNLMEAIMKENDFEEQIARLNKNLSELQEEHKQFSAEKGKIKAQSEDVERYKRILIKFKTDEGNLKDQLAQAKKELEQVKAENQKLSEFSQENQRSSTWLDFDVHSDAVLKENVGEAKSNQSSPSKMAEGDIEISQEPEFLGSIVNQDYQPSRNVQGERPSGSRLTILDGSPSFPRPILKSHGKTTDL